MLRNSSYFKPLGKWACWKSYQPKLGLMSIDLVENHLDSSIYSLMMQVDNFDMKLIIRNNNA
jgi:hypothetical protein